VHDDPTTIDDIFLDEHFFSLIEHDPWYANIPNYLTIGITPVHFSPKDRRMLGEKSSNFSWIASCKFYTGPNQVMHRCIREDETYDIPNAFHDEPCGGNFSTKRTTLKFLTTRYYWPTLHKDATKYTEKCGRCQ
jgi:hypothetical protein